MTRRPYSARAAAVAALSFAPLGAAVRADPMTGDTGAAYTTAESASLNPANAGMIDRTQATLAPEIYQNEKLSIRYPGFAPNSETNSGLGSLLSFKPSFIIKATPRLGIAGYFLPPVNFEVDIDKKNIPAIILGTKNDVDLKATGKPNGVGAAIIGYKVNDKLALGASINHIAVSFVADLTTSDKGANLAHVAGSLSDTSTVVGLRVDPVPGRLAFGIAATVLNMHEETMQIESPFLSSAASEGDSDLSQANSKSSTPLSSLLVGIQAGSARLRLLADLQYTRANHAQETLSLVELKKKKKDTYDTTSARLGMILSLGEGFNYLLGFRYEPSALGPGSRGTDTQAGTVGFGTIDLVTVYTGFVPMAPYWQLGTGVQLGACPTNYTNDELKDRKRSSSRGFYRCTFAVGIAYRRASLGIDQNGELPGAYLYEKTYIPVSLTFKL